MKAYIIIGKNKFNHIVSMPVMTCSKESAIAACKIWSKQEESKEITSGILTYELMTQGKNFNQISFPIKNEKEPK